MRWRRIDPPGQDQCTLHRTLNGWTLRGRARFASGRSDHDLRYQVDADRRFQTVKARVKGTVGGRPVSYRIRVLDGRWSIDGKPRPRLDGCVDVDLAFTPATNLLPIRRLQLAIGESESVDAAWLQFPEFDLKRLPQVYHRLAPNTYQYRSGRFEAALTVDRRGFVVHYGDLWTRMEST